MKQYTLEELNEFLETEEYQQLDELSKKTLGSYIKKASTDAVNNASEGGYKLGGNAGNVYKDDEDEGESNDRKAATRTKGIKRAIDKLVKESQDLDNLFYQIDNENLSDAKELVSEIIGNKVSDVLATMKQTIAGKLVNESSCSKENGDEEAAEAVAKLPKPTKAKKLKDGDDKIIDEPVNVKESENLDELSVPKLQAYIGKSLDGSPRKTDKKTWNNIIGVARAANKIAKKITKEDLDETIVQSKNKSMNDAVDRIVDKAKANTKTVNLKDLFKKKDK